MRKLENPMFGGLPESAKGKKCERTSSHNTAFKKFFKKKLKNSAPQTICSPAIVSGNKSEKSEFSEKYKYSDAHVQSII